MRNANRKLKPELNNSSHILGDVIIVLHVVVVVVANIPCLNVTMFYSAVV